MAKTSEIPALAELMYTWGRGHQTVIHARLTRFGVMGLVVPWSIAHVVEESVLEEVTVT